MGNGIWEKMILGKWDFGKGGDFAGIWDYVILRKWAFGKVGFWDFEISGNWENGV